MHFPRLVAVPELKRVTFVPTSSSNKNFQFFRLVDPLPNFSGQLGLTLCNVVNNLTSTREKRTIDGGASRRQENS